VNIKIVETVEGLGDPVRGVMVTVTLNRDNLNSVVPLLRGRFREDGLEVILRSEISSAFKKPCWDGWTLPFASGEMALGVQRVGVRKFSSFPPCTKPNPIER